MEVDTNELLHRIGAVLRGISKKLDLLVEMASDHSADASKMVAKEPAKEPEPEHPAGPMPDPGEGYRILSKDPPEELTPGDDFEDWNGEWIRSSNAETNKKQGATCWYRRKIEQPKPPEPEYREPVLPGDYLKDCEFSDSGENWYSSRLYCWRKDTLPWLCVGLASWRYARIKVDA